VEAGLMQKISRSCIAWLIHDSICTIFSVTFCPLPFRPRTEGSVSGTIFCNYRIYLVF